MSILSVLETRKDLDVSSVLHLVLRANTVHVGDDYFTLLIPLKDKKELIVTKSMYPTFSYKHLKSLVKLIKSSKNTLEIDVNFIPVYHEDIDKVIEDLTRLGFVKKQPNKYIREKT
jgi:hypothetical protein